MQPQAPHTLLRSAQSICGNLKSARPKGVDGEQTQTGAAKLGRFQPVHTGVGKTIGEPLENHRKMVVLMGFDGFTIWLCQNCH